MLSVQPRELFWTAAAGPVNHPPAPNSGEHNSSDQEGWKEATGGLTLLGKESFREGE